MESDASLRRMLDEREILDLFARYCRGIDRLDEDLIRACYHDDSTDDHGAYEGSGIEFASFIVPALRQAFTATQHFLGQTLFEFASDDCVRCETYVIAHHRREDGDGEMLESVGARYVDRVERRDGQWKLADRVVVYDWSTSQPVASWMPIDSFVPGVRSRDDLAYG